MVEGCQGSSNFPDEDGGHADDGLEYDVTVDLQAVDPQIDLLRAVRQLVASEYRQLERSEDLQVPAGPVHVVLHVAAPFVDVPEGRLGAERDPIRMDVAENDVAPGPNDARHFRDRGRGIVEVRQRQRTDGEVDRAGVEPERGQLTDPELGVRDACPGSLEHRRARVDADDVVAQLGQDGRLPAGAASGVEGSPRLEPGEELGHERPLEMQRRVRGLVIRSGPGRVSLVGCPERHVVPIPAWESREPLELVQDRVDRLSLADQPVTDEGQAGEREVELERVRQLLGSFVPGVHVLRLSD